MTNRKPVNPCPRYLTCREYENGLCNGEIKTYNARNCETKGIKYVRFVRGECYVGFEDGSLIRLRANKNLNWGKDKTLFDRDVKRVR